MYRFLLLFLLIGHPAQAQELAECRYLPAHVPGDDVAYQPGVDVDGNAVVPADLNPSPIPVPDPVVIPLSMNLAARLTDPPEGLLAEAPIGFLEVYQNGRIAYEGRDISSQVYALCGQEWEELPPETPPAVDGQGSAEPLNSAPSGDDDIVSGGEGRDAVFE